MRNQRNASWVGGTGTWGIGRDVRYCSGEVRCTGSCGERDSLADKAILSGADNRPPMLEKDMYDSWKSRMELYMLNRQHGRMILKSVEHVEAIQADCDVKATNIILQGLPLEVYALVSTYKVAKELWERIQMLMQGTSLTTHERECKLYDEFDKFVYRKGETLLHDALRSSNGDDSHNSGTGVRRTERAARECTYTDFLKCQPLPFKGTEGVASLSQWCERMESVFHISNCSAENQVKFATCTLHSVALTWWNTHVQTVGHEATYDMSWKTLMKMMTDKYCP
nr:hypothetical protein [Tanacetum cinerariifolium]